MQSDVITIFDTTLRDGEQSPGASLDVHEKVDIAHQLKRLSVDVIEAGFPVSSQVQFDAVERIAGEVPGPSICGLARSVEKDIRSAWAAIKQAPSNRIHTFISTSPVHMKHKLKKEPADVLKMAVAAVEMAKSLCDDVEFSPEDAGRTELGFLCEVVEAVIGAGATTVNIPDTVGYMLPAEYAEMIGTLVDNVSNIGDAVISTHCHNDLGLAVANSLEGVRRGARQVECTMNGLGERAGNASLEEIVMSIHTRSDYFPGLTTAISTEQIVPTSQMVSRMTGMHVQANKSIVGANAFAHESGIHQDGMLKHRETYEIMTPADVGWSKSRMVLGRHSGRHGFQSRLEALGYHVADEDLDRAYERFLLVADKKKEVFDEDLAAIIDDEVREVVQTFKLEHLQVSSGTGTIPSATVRIKVLDEMRQEAAWGDGPVDAAYTAITKAAGVDVTLEEYVIRAVTSGRKALGEVSVRIREKEKTVLGRGASTDVVEASTKAFIDALNRLTEQRSGENG